MGGIWSGSVGWDGSARFAVVDHTNGLRYQVQIRAVNAAGAGNPSQTTATPTATPGP